MPDAPSPAVDWYLMADVDAEVGLLGALLHDLPASARVRAVVAPDDFEGFAHQALFLAAVQATSANELKVWLERRNLLSAVGGCGAIDDLRDQSPGSVNAACFARIVHEEAGA